MTRAVAALLALFALFANARLGAADAETDADRAFHAALAAGDIDALERLGAARPTTRWTDDAWAEAARLAARASDFPRARRGFEKVLAVSTDPVVVRRARAELARLTSATGSSGEWSAVAAEHERIVPTLHAGGDPQPALRALEALARANPTYPRRALVMMAIANGWEREGDGDAAAAWLRRAGAAAGDPLERLRAEAELVRTLIRTGDLDAATTELAALASTGPAVLVGELHRSLERARWRLRVRALMIGALVLLAGLATFALRRAAGSWRAAARRLARPPVETLFLVPIAIVLVIVAYTGNPLVARAVRTIVIAGIAATWISGAILAGTRVALRRALVHALCAILAVGAATYVAVDDGHLIDFVRETWRAGHERG